ncbi:MAG TPA: hypothetical protein VMT27_06070, partial [Actinomycetes bacterium]|nr:hypothetical protein [Actinomycetes bacterium]
MSEGAKASGCDVVALVPHPSGSEMLICASPEQGREDRLELPRLQLGPEPESTEITQALGQLLGGHVTLLRANARTWHDNFDAASMIVEVEPVMSELPQGFGWQPVDELDAESILPEWARESAASWLRERASGWSDLRPQWSRPGWMSRASAWMRERMQLAGYPDPQCPQIHQLWGVSVVLSAESSSGTAYLKCS